MTVSALQASPAAVLPIPAAALPRPVIAEPQAALAPASSSREAPRALPAQPQVIRLSALTDADAARVNSAVSLAHAMRDGATSGDLRESLDALQRDKPELYQRALDLIAADFFATPSRIAYARALITSTTGTCNIAGDIYARIGPKTDLPDGKPLTSSELAAIGAGISDFTELPRPAVRDMASGLRMRALEPAASHEVIDAAVRARVSLLRTCPSDETSEADENALTNDIRFAFGPRDGALDAIDKAVPTATRVELQRTMLARGEALVKSGDLNGAAELYEALSHAAATVDPSDSARLQFLMAHAAAVRDAAPVGFANPVSARVTPEIPLPWLADGLAGFLHSNPSDMATHLIGDTPDIPAPVAAAFRARLEAALTTNIERGDSATRAITLDVHDANGDHRAYTYDLQRYHGKKDSSDPHLHAAGLRFASEAGRVDLAAIRTRDAALAYANKVIDTVAQERITDKYLPLTDSQRVAMRDGIVGWFNLATHHGMPVNPVLRVIDEAQKVSSINRAININLETGHEQKIWANGSYDRLSGLTSSTLRGDTDGDGHMDFFSNILNRRAFELGFFNLHLYRGKHGRTLQQDGVNPRFQSQWDPQLAAMHVAPYVRKGPPVVSGRSNMCDAIEDNAASRSAIVDFDGAMMFRHALTDNAGVAKRWSANVKRQDYTGKIWHTNDAALGWGPIPDYTPIPKSIYPDLVQGALKS